MLIFTQNYRTHLYATLGNSIFSFDPWLENNGVTWVDPSLQIEVSYFEETEGGHFRFLVFNRIVR